MSYFLTLIMDSARKKLFLTLFVSTLVIGLFVVSSLYHPRLNFRTEVLRFVFLTILLIANTSVIVILSRVKSWHTKEWFSLVSFILVNLFLIKMVYSTTDFIFRTILLLVMVVNLFLLTTQKKEDLKEELAKEAEALEEAEEKIEELKEGSKEVKDKERFVASSSGKVFHKKDCPFVKNIPRKKRIYFEDRQDAISSGYTPCKVCNP